jgi:hypothetical protein
MVTLSLTGHSETPFVSGRLLNRYPISTNKEIVRDYTENRTEVRKR